MEVQCFGVVLGDSKACWRLTGDKSVCEQQSGAASRSEDHVFHGFAVLTVDGLAELFISPCDY